MSDHSISPQFTGITLLGLGPGDPALLTRQAWEIIQNSSEIYLRTQRHPTVAGFPKGVEINNFDHLYDEFGNFGEVYEEIIRRVLALGARPHGVVYAVPGHPFVAESTSPEIYRRAKETGLEVRVVEGLSFVESVFTALGVDPLPRATIVDAFEIAAAHHPWFPPDAPALIAQVYSKALASELKMTLMAVYPDGHPVKLVHGAGTPDLIVEEILLYELDRSDHIGLLTSLYVPSLGEYTSFESFQEIIAQLRAPEGCPWDRKQTHLTLRPYLLEETYETLAALDAGDPEKLREEFGDLLLQIVLHAQIAVEDGEFNMSDIVRGISEKLIYRHPHVFEDLEIEDAEGVVDNWEKLKAEERREKGEGESVLNGVSIALPALAQSSAYQKRASRVGFEWPEIEGVYEKILEEIEEVRSAPDEQNRADEIGDLLFAVVHLADWYKIDPETALREANGRFRDRFTYVESNVRKSGREMGDMKLDDLNALWEEAKRNPDTHK